MKLQNAIATLTAIASVYAIGCFCLSWFPAMRDLFDFFDFLR